MAIRIMKSREINSSPGSLVKDAIDIGMKYKDVAAQSKFYRRLRVNGKIADTIRDCNNFLSMSGNFKNGCLYREEGLSEIWKKGNGEEVVCEHAVPVTELVRRYHDGEKIERLIFSPVVRITKKSNDELTRRRFAKRGWKLGFPLFRYSEIKMSVITHFGKVVDPSTWTDEDHWNLVLSTEELWEVLNELGIRNGLSETR